MQSVIYFILVPMVYIACAIFLVGTVLRIVKIWQYPKHPTTLQIFPEKKPKWLWTLYDTFMFPTVLRHKPLLWVFLMAFHISLVLLLIGHLELIAEFGIFQIVPHEVFIGNGYVGLTLAVCLLFFLFRRMISPVKDLSVPEDYYLLILLFLIVIFGSEMDWARRWYEYGEMTVEDYRDLPLQSAGFQTGSAIQHNVIRPFFHAGAARFLRQPFFDAFPLQPADACGSVTPHEQIEKRLTTMDSQTQDGTVETLPRQIHPSDKILPGNLHPLRHLRGSLPRVCLHGPYQVYLRLPARDHPAAL